MTDQTVWAGVDLGQKQSHVCIIDDTGTTLSESVCETTFAALSEAVVPPDGANFGLIAVEAGGEPHVIRKLRSAGFPVALFESRKASRYLAIRRNKSDVSDARGLADLARLGQNSISQVHLKSLECQQLRSQLVLRRRLVKVRVATEQAIKSRLAMYGKRISRQHSAELMRQRVIAQIDDLNAEEGINLRGDLEPLIEVALSLRKYIGQLDKQLEKTAKEHSVCRRLMGVAGVGTICSLSFYSAIEDPDRFKRTADVAAYLGLVPRRYQSGEASYTRGITKTGSTMTRTHLVSAALVFATKGPDSELKTWATTLKDRAGSKRARVALARKLSIILLTMWKTGVAFEPFPSVAPLASR